MVGVKNHNNKKKKTQKKRKQTKQANKNCHWMEQLFTH